MNLILTFDYELFGDGSGNIFDHMIYPTDIILKTCQKHGIKTTLFFEVVEYWAIKKEWQSGNKMGYKEDPIQAIENQLIKAYQDGHDIQLHFHPQWLNASFINGKWNVDFENWRLGDLSRIENFDIHTLLKKGKETINEIIRKSDIDLKYKCNIIRAGGYNIMPSQNIYKAMISEGFLIDSSVYPGGYEEGPLSIYNYKKVPLDKDFWYASKEDITKSIKEDDGIIEIPIFALQQKRWKKIGLERIKSMLLNKNAAVKNLKNKTSNKSFVKKITYWLENEALTWDFCLFNQKMHNVFFRYIDKNLKNKRNHFVLIGHPKNFTSEKTLEYLINTAKSKNYSFITLSDYASKISN